MNRSLRHRSVRIAAMTAALGVLCVGSVFAGPITYSLQADAWGGPIESSFEEGTIRSHSPGNARVARATAEAGSVGAAAYASSPIGYVDVGASASAGLRYDDLIITSTDPTVAFVDAILNMNLTFTSGSVTSPFEAGAGGLYTAVTYPALSAAKAYMSWSLQVAGQSRGGSLFLCQVSKPGLWENMCGQTGPEVELAVTVTNTFDPSVSAIQEPFRLPVGRPLSGHVGVRVGAAVEGFDRAIAEASYANTFSFVQGSPVFTLPPGFTANSASLGIVNNRWNESASPVPVPEPASLLLLGAGATAAVIRRRCRLAVRAEGSENSNSVLR